jgi:hypothetical protein
MKRHAKVMAHGPRQENRAGRFDFFRHIPSDSHRDCRYAASFNFALDQSDGLMADRSSGGKQGGVGSLFHCHGFGDILGDRAFKFLRVHAVADEAEEIRGEPTQHALGG